jgi:hypothetical protein
MFSSLGVGTVVVLRLAVWPGVDSRFVSWNEERRSGVRLHPAVTTVNLFAESFFFCQLVNTRVLCSKYPELSCSGHVHAGQ